ncbi:MAG: hypothetical protein WBQ08_13535 [Candidatus Sulfotelmatobacter sp.]
MAVSILVLCVFSCATTLSQQKPAASAPSGTLEFPVVMQQNVAAGKTPVGAKIRAKLEVATLIDGKVVPRNAVFSGEVIESVAKTPTDPSRLAIRINSVLWKKESESVTAYLTAWYYPTIDSTGQDLQYGPEQPAKRTWNGLGQYPDTTTKVYRPFPGSDTGNGGSVPDTPASATSNRRVLMKDVESAKNNDGVIAIVSKSTNIKLDKLTTYVLATGDLLPAK